MLVTVKMLDNDRGCDNEMGKFQPENYHKGETYKMGSDLAGAFIKAGSAKINKPVKISQKKESLVSKAVKAGKKMVSKKENKQTKGDEDK